MLGIRNILILAAGGFAFSFFFSLIGGNSFFMILKKSVIGSLLLTLVSAAALIVLKKIIDTVNTDTAADSDSPSDSYSDLADNPHDDDIAIDYELEKKRSVAVEEIDEEQVNSYDFVEEVEEDSVEDISMLDSLDNEDEVVEVMNDDNSNLIDNDIIPDMNKSSSFSDRRNDDINSLGDNLDAGTMAKAIKTILSRDQKG